MNSTKVHILSAAKSVLIKQGSAGFSMRKVAEEASVRLNNVQYYFKTKADLIDGLLSNYTEESKNALLENVQQSGNGKQGITSFIASICQSETIEDEIKLSIALTSLAEQEEIGIRLHHFYSDFYNLLFDFFQQVSGKDKKALCLHQAASLLLPFINGYGLVSKNIDLDYVDTSEMLSDLLWNMINDTKLD